MKFQRRTDLDKPTRLILAAMMHVSFRWGAVTDLATSYGVSRQFLYDNKKEVLNQIGSVAEPSEGLSKEQGEKLALCMRLHGKSSLEGIKRTLQEMDAPCSSVGYLSGLFSCIARQCELPETYHDNPAIVMMDETFSNNVPILVILDGKSHCILEIILAKDRSAETWKRVIESLQIKGLKIKRVVKDQGSSLKAAAKELGLPEQADIFHLLHPFDRFLQNFERRAYGSITHEEEVQRIFLNRKREPALQKQMKRYDQAVEDCNKAIDSYDNYEYLHNLLHDCFNSFTSTGILRTKTMVLADINAALDLHDETFGGHHGIMTAVKFVRKNIKDYIGSLEEQECIITQYAQQLPEDILQATCLAWQLERKAMAVKQYAMKKQLAEHSREWMDLVMCCSDDQQKEAIHLLHCDLEANIRSSSALEAINSIIRVHLNTCRGQITQEFLNMIAFHLNHTSATRGKYKGTSPIERMNSVAEKTTSIKKLLEIKAQRCINAPVNV